LDSLELGTKSQSPLQNYIPCSATKGEFRYHCCEIVKELDLQLLN